MSRLLAAWETERLATSSRRTSNTVDQAIRINQTVRLNIAGNKAEPIWVSQPRTRIVYMHIDASTWRWAIKKAEHSEDTFTMRYVVADFDLNINKYLAAAPKPEAICNKVVGISLAELAKNRNPPLINPNA
ncbi:hypothetical protein LZ32DRAFT_622915 [Colletotrichum eremochloae]|nr:hypothetical protein LZ32DRAFT_622915 [Colletotrichum eremochloae]